jgi:hypothetical protein
VVETVKAPDFVAAARTCMRTRPLRIEATLSRDASRRRSA